MMTGKLQEDPYTAEHRTTGANYLDAWVRQKGFHPTPTKEDLRQRPRIRLLQAFLRACGDPDAEALDTYATGVRLGYMQRMPRTPAVFTAKAKWRLKYEAHEAAAEDWTPNYKSARERLGFLEAKVKEDVAAGRMITTTVGAARKKNGERFLVGAISVIEEGREKFRLVHDGTHKTFINNRIRARDHIPGPLVGDMAKDLQETDDEGMLHIGVVWDFASAHRVCQVHPSEWGSKACTPADLRGSTPSDGVAPYLNTVGTFGFSTAGHWWGRLAAMLTRACRYFLGVHYKVRMMIFADDGKTSIPLNLYRRVFLALFCFLVALGMDVKWTKIRGGFQFQWIGYWLNLEAHRVGISQKHGAWVIKWLTDLLSGTPIEADFDSGLGRLSFVCGAIACDMPFLAPLYSHAAAVRKRTGKKVNATSLPPYVKCVLEHLRARLGHRIEIHCSLGQAAGSGTVERFRTDAKAEGDLVTVGGYQTHNGCCNNIHQRDAKWFFLKLTRQNAPWAFTEGEPFRIIASLELLGSLMGTMLQLGGDEGPEIRCSARISVGGLTDNAGKKFGVARLLTRKCVYVMRVLRINVCRHLWRLRCTYVS